MAVWPLLTLQFGRPTSSLGEFLLNLCATISVFAPAALCMAAFMDMVRFAANARTLTALVLSLASIAAIALYIYLRLRTP